MGKYKYEITKIYRFEAGHRVWTQNLAQGRGASLSGNACPPENKCRHLHGHSYVVEITLGSDTLDNDMVMDFYHLKSAVKELIDYKLDHSFIIDKNDPLYPSLKEMAKEFGLKLFEVDFVPTAERLAEFIYRYLKEKLQKAGVKDVDVVEVVIWETATSKASYKEE
ncbi:MAG: 6-carboxytetrahydropterin synthase [Aquificota bacterium]|jgi:6-pyruvoyltetrahydropterin/6-carboxytetrahydropterin synthase